MRKVSCTIAAFSSADQRGRRCTDVITSTCSIFPVIDTVVLLVLNHEVDPVRFFRGLLQRLNSPAADIEQIITDASYFEPSKCLMLNSDVSNLSR